jgi:hypothetical protein
MAENNFNKIPILEVAWTHYAQLDAASSQRSHPHRRLRRWVSILGVLATLFAILTQIYPSTFPAIGGLVLKVILIATPITGSVLAAFINKFYSSGDWLVTRAGAEEIKKEIYTFRTILKRVPDRRAWLEKRLADIQRQVYRGMGGELVLKGCPSQVPPYYDPKNPNSDPGFSDLTGDEYFRYRLQDQLRWHIVKVNEFQAKRKRLQLLILIAGAAGALLAAFGGFFTIWVALTSSLAAAFIGWQELLNLDSLVKNYSKVIIELTIIFDHWDSLEPEERTDAEFFQMVQGTEDILWSQNVEYIKSMQEVLAQSRLEEADIINNVLRNAVESDAQFKQSLREQVVASTSQATTDSQQALEDTYKAAYGSLAEEASSELVQQELEAMAKAASTAVQTVTARASQLTDSLGNIAKEFAHLKPNKETPKEKLNELIARFPPTGDLKG